MEYKRIHSLYFCFLSGLSIEFTAVYFFEKYIQEPDNILCPSCVEELCIEGQVCDRSYNNTRKMWFPFQDVAERVHLFPLWTEFGKWILLFDLFLWVSLDTDVRINFQYLQA